MVGSIWLRYKLSVTAETRWTGRNSNIFQLYLCTFTEGKPVHVHAIKAYAGMEA